MTHVSGTLLTPKLTYTSPFGSCSTGQSPPLRGKKSRTFWTVSLLTTVTSSAPSACCAWAVANRSSSGCSCTHGGHHVPKKFSTTHEPLRCDRSNVLPSMVVARTAGAGWSSSGVLAVSRVPLLASAKTTTNTASTSATPRAVNSTVRPRRGAGAGGSASGSTTTSTIVGSHQLGGGGALGGGRRRHRVDRTAAASGEGGQDRADDHDGGTDPQPQHEGHDAHGQRGGAVGVGLAFQGEVDVLPPAGADGGRADGLARRPEQLQGRPVHLAAVDADVGLEVHLAGAVDGAGAQVGDGVAAGA